jgi:hypothetical protein
MAHQLLEPFGGKDAALEKLLAHGGANAPAQHRVLRQGEVNAVSRVEGIEREGHGAE